MKFLKEFAIKTAIICFFAAFGIHLYLSHLVSARVSELARLQKSCPISEFTSLDSDPTFLQDRLGQLNQKVNFMTEIMDHRHFFTTKMNRIAKGIPPSFRLTSLTYDDNVSLKAQTNILLHLGGYLISGDPSGDYAALNKLVAALSNDKEFMQGIDEVKIVSARKTTIREFAATEFAIDCVGAKGGGIP